MIPGFQEGRFTSSGAEIAYETGGYGPPLLLLHGFPQTRAMWAEIAPALAENHTVIAADLRGYGASSKPEGVENYSFREMGRDMFELMAHLGHESFILIGHDRGARTAHRMALDAPRRISKIALMDIIPTHLLLDDLKTETAKGYYHWFFLAQPAPFPETLIGHDPDSYFESCLLGWGASQLPEFSAARLAAYRTAWRDPQTIRAMCNDYRAALDIDFTLDHADLHRQLNIPALILAGTDGLMAKSYDMKTAWSERFKDPEVTLIPGGHFFPDTAPEHTTEALMNFLKRPS